MEEQKALITIIVQRKDGQKVVDAAVKAGAPGVTYFYARGTGVRQKLGIFGFLIEAEKQVINIVVPEFRSEDILDQIVRDAGIGQPGKGFAYIQPVGKVIGFFEG